MAPALEGQSDLSASMLGAARAAARAYCEERPDDPGQGVRCLRARGVQVPRVVGHHVAVRRTAWSMWLWCSGAGRGLGRSSASLRVWREPWPGSTTGVA